MLDLSTISNIAAVLPSRARSHPYRLAALCPQGKDSLGRVAHTHLTFQQLDQESDLLAGGLIKAGMGKGVRTVLMVPPSLEFFALTFALFKAGAIPILVDPGMGMKNLGNCLAEAEPQAFIGIPKAHVARQIFGWARNTLRSLVTVGRKLTWGGISLEQVREYGLSRPLLSIEEFGPEETAAILFTSGSTGIPKGVVYTQSIFCRQLELLQTIYGIEPGEIDLATFPLFALFGPALGMTAIIPDMDATRPALVNPVNIIQAIRDFGVTNLFGSPALLHRVSLYAEQYKIQLPSLRRVISAGAPVSPLVIERVLKMVPADAAVHTPYGATEALPVSTIAGTEIVHETRHATFEGKGVCVGRPVEGVEVAIITITDDPIDSWTADLQLPSGQIGEIAVKGPMVTPSYYNRPSSTHLAKIADPHGGFWHRMGDVGYLDDKGRLWMCGRKSHRVTTKSQTLFTVCCEGVFNAHPLVYRSALVGVPREGQNLPVLCVELRPEAKNANPREISGELLKLGSKHNHTRDIQTILYHPAFPVDIRHNSKIFREKLALWAARKLP